MSAFKPPSGRASRSEVRTLSSASESNAVGTSQPKRQNSFSGRSIRLSNGGRETPVTGVSSVNRIMGQFDRDIAQTPVGRRGLVIGNTQSELEQLENEAKLEIIKEEKKLKNMESRGKTPINDINKQKNRVKRAEKKLTEVESAIEQVMESKTPKRRRNNNTTVEPIKRTKSTDELPTITNQPPKNIPKPTPKTKSVDFLTQLKNATGKINRSKETVVETQAPPKKTPSPQKTPSPKKTPSPQKTPSPKKTSPPKTQRQLFTETPNQPTPNPTQLPSIKKQHKEAKRAGAKRASNERREKWEREGPPAIRKALEPIFNKMAKSPKTPPGITKTNIERLLQPFKQPVTVTVAPSISVKGGSAKATGGSLQQTQIQYNTPANKKKKPLKLIRSPETMRKEKSAAFRKEIISKLRSPAATKRREALYSLRTPTVGQRKKHVIQLIDRVLRRMKAPKDAENKLIKFYEGLSEKQIKSLFGGRSPEFVKITLKKQVDYLKKKKR